MATTTAVPVTETAAVLARAGAALQEARDRLARAEAEGDKFQQFDAERAVRAALAADAAARIAHRDAREVEFAAQVAAYEKADGVDVGQLAKLLQQAAAVEARRAAAGVRAPERAAVSARERRLAGAGGRGQRRHVAARALGGVGRSQSRIGRTCVNA
jgi:hypothetical protein